MILHTIISYDDIFYKNNIEAKNIKENIIFTTDPKYYIKDEPKISTKLLPPKK